MLTYVAANPGVMARRSMKRVDATQRINVHFVVDESRIDTANANSGITRRFSNADPEVVHGSKVKT